MNVTELNNKIIQYLSAYNPSKIGVFGSYARNENTPASDIDILIDFKETVSLLEIIRIERELSEILGIKVDLVTDRSIQHPGLRQHIEQNLNIIYE